MKDLIKVDSNEPPEVIKEIRDRADFKVKVESLDQGDFLYPHQSVAIERKEGSDLANSIQDRRVKEQTSRMRAQHDHVYLIAEGELFDLAHSNIHKNSVTGQIISLAVKKGVRVVPTKDKGSTGYAVNRIFERHRDGEHKEQTEYLKRHDTGEVEDLEVAMLIQIDGISEEKAKEITEKYYFRDGLCGFGAEIRSDYRQILNDLQMIDGIGPKTAEKVIKAFRPNIEL